MVFLTLDNNKKISSIAYNHLNLPTAITVTGKGTITYTYDAAGNKLKKEVNETGQPLKTTLYVAGAVYENDVLQFIAHEEGRVRKSGTAYVYDYFIKDHLGNVRMVLTEEQKTDAYPAATMETGAITTESTWYGNLTNTQYGKPSWFNDPNYSTNAQVGRLKNESGSQKIGPNIILKVMAGDTYNIRVASGWYSGSATNNSTNVLNDLFNLLSAGMANVSGGKATQAELQNSSSGLNAGLTSFLGQQTTSGTKPKAYISWILLDEQFKIAKDANGNMIANGYSGFDQVKDAGSAYVHYFTNLTVNKSGYLYIYTSNEATNIDVFFDNLQVTHIRGPLLEENSFYPFGLQMRNISYRSLKTGYAENKKMFTSQDLDDDLGLNLYQMRFRNHDPQIGRFIQIDPLAPQYVHNSTYAYAENDVIRAIDLEGLEKYVITNEKVQDHLYKVSIARILRKDQTNKLQPLNSNIKMQDDKGNPITKDVLRLQNNVLINREKNDVTQSDGMSKGEQFIRDQGIIETDVVGKNNVNNVQMEILDGGKVEKVGDVFDQAGDTYRLSEGYVSGISYTTSPTNSIATQADVIHQVNQLLGISGNDNNANFQISISSGSGPNPTVKKLSEVLKKIYPNSSINMVEDKKRIKASNSTEFNFNVTIHAATEKK